jgi:hypothetical protein
LSADDIGQLRGGNKRKAAVNCVSPTLAANDMMSLNKDMTERMEARNKAKENHRKEWLSLEAKQLEVKNLSRRDSSNCNSSK